MLFCPKFVEGETMKIARATIPFILAVLIIVASCGGGGGGDISGPILDVSEIKSLILEQFYINGGMEDEYRARGEFSVYVRDAATGLDVACTTQDGGMKLLTAPGIYYGDLTVKFQEVEGNEVNSVARFQLVFVETDGGGCPAPIDAEDDIAGISGELTSDDLLGAIIWATNGRGAAVLRSEVADAGSVASMAPSLTDGLSIDKLMFEFEPGEGENPRFYIFVESDEGTQCQVDDDLMDSIRSGGVLYAALGFPITCFDPADPDFPNIRIQIGLYVQTDSGPEQVAETEFVPIGDLVGERANFNDNKGFISFRSVRDECFAAPVVRLADLTDTQVTELSHDAAPTSAGAVELHVIDAVSGQTVACAGAAQGLAGIEAAGPYDDLAATLVAAGWEREIFGYADIYLALVERSDGLACPALPAEVLPVLAITGALTPSQLMAGEADFVTGGGGLGFVAAAAD